MMFCVFITLFVDLLARSPIGNSTSGPTNRQLRLGVETGLVVLAPHTLGVLGAGSKAETWCRTLLMKVVLAS
jgi:hypothetical protein